MPFGFNRSFNRNRNRNVNRNFNPIEVWMSVQTSLNYLVPSDLLVVRDPVGLVLRAPLGRLVPLEVGEVRGLARLQIAQRSGAIRDDLLGRLQFLNKLLVF